MEYPWGTIHVDPSESPEQMMVYVESVEITGDSGEFNRKPIFIVHRSNSETLSSTVAVALSEPSNTEFRSLMINVEVPKCRVWGSDLGTTKQMVV